MAKSIESTIYIPPLPYVEVQWYDSCAFEKPWYIRAKAETKTVPLIQTIGFLVLENSIETILCQSYGTEGGEAGELGGLFAIPTTCIERIIDL